MSRTSSNGYPDSRDLADRLPATDAVCSGHGNSAHNDEARTS